MDTQSSPLALEWAMTETFRRHTTEEGAISAKGRDERELAALRTQFPACLQMPWEGDLLAGRHDRPLVGFSPEPGGLAYYADLEALEERAHDDSRSEEERVAARELMAFWQGRTTAAQTRSAYPPEVARLLPSDEWMTEAGLAFPLYRIAGMTLDWERLLSAGLPVFREEIRAMGQEETEGSDGQRYLEGTVEALGILDEVLAFYAASLAEGDFAEIAAICGNLRQCPPRTMREALQLQWLYAVLAGVLNHGRMDVWAGPFLARDLEAGRLDEAGAVALLRSHWRLQQAQGNIWNHRVYLGGEGRPDPEVADAFALLAMEATRQESHVIPQLSLRFSREGDQRLYQKALDLLGEGLTYPILYCDEVNLPAFRQSAQVTPEDAQSYTPFGCGEVMFDHRSVASPNGVINLMKAVELVLQEGTDAWDGTSAPTPTAEDQWPKRDQLATFEDFWEAYAKTVESSLAALAEQQKIEYEVTGREGAFFLQSALYDDCLARQKPLLDGGVRYLAGTIETYGNTDAADSLTAIRRLVYEEQSLTLEELSAACRNDFVGSEELQKRLLALPKYGNDDAEADAMAVRVHEHACRVASQQAARVGLHHYLVVNINNSANTILGHQTGASPSGRRAGKPLANGNNPAPGADQSGVTAFLNSLGKMDPNLHGGATQNMKFSRRLFRQERPKLEALLTTWWRRGGAQAMLTVVDAAELEAAMREPEAWGHLMVRVGGFSARFVELGPDVQEEILRRTLHG